MQYSELHSLSNYSFLRAASHPDELVAEADALGYQALAITDECSVAGVVRAYREAKKRAVKLIVGSEFQLPEIGVFVVLCPTRSAYTQLCRYITKARGRAEKGRYDAQFLDFLSEFDDALLLWSPAPELEQAVAVGKRLKSYWQDRMWLLYERHYQDNDIDQVTRLKSLQRNTQVPIVCAGGVLMHRADRQPLQDTLTAIRLNQPISACYAELLTNSERHLRSLTELQRCYPDKWLAETQVIAERCHFCLSELAYQYPAELVPEGISASDYLRQLTYVGVKKRFPNGPSDTVKAKIEKELALIATQSYEYFFLTIYDLVQFAQQRNILYQGRGSAANSVVCYCLEITAVNPDQIDVLFERFISEERDEPPDIDVDFEHERREEVIQYIYQKYGRQRAALAASVITYRFKSAFRDVGKALGFTEQQLQHYLQKIDRRTKAHSWQQQLISDDPTLANDLRGRWLMQLVDEIRGFPRHLSQHVGGFVIAATELSEWVPTENAAMAERTVIQWDKDDLETLGLLKVDVLALGMLTALRKMLELVNQQQSEPLTLATIPQEDSKVYRRLQQADSIGIFQIESRAQMTMLPRLKPATFYDLVIQIAIVRPGPIQGDMVHPYLRRRNGQEAVDYPSDETRQVLQRTLGVPIFQEQVIKLVMVAAGFSGGEADQLRRAMATWRSRGQLEKFYRRLVEGMTARGYSNEYAERIYQQICGFGEYGFPESHSASFANLAYASAWMKTYYPSAFYVGLLNSLPMGFYSASQLIQDAQRHDILFLPADINHSQWDYQWLAPDDAIRMGLRQIAGVSESRLLDALKQRPAAGFRSIDELRKCGLSSHDIDALAAADALFSIAGHRHQARWQTLEQSDDQLALFDGKAPTSSTTEMLMPQASEIEDISEDYASMALSLRRHPLALLREQGLLRGIKTATELPHCRSGQIVTVVGLVTCRQRPGTKSGVTFLTLEDETGNMNVVIWAHTATQFRVPYLTSRLLWVRGVVEIKDNVVHVIAGRIRDETEALRLERVQSRNFH
ncbi:error-prone DNA polymerase [Idiomarina tyrosinivorans]|uniref:Error-prone DNA polymerase n=1 Tax=Idiomarina tyrosinivorans TaxID=1445662 RepID=A0A432ZSL5_9GAMM|nr:error-prone DNA polymerase [Idiomarina tyrosinivorans]RUO80914.1 error-prone DNA polymerase [Idiomarina tyrosinivorans]